ncbi:single-stranded DNA-binding protein [Candidatus Peregrinibacteria bacterium]|nr:single-stranded DNA-binding protein [Candidatus Peregrinibacteria bacterium]
MAMSLNRVQLIGNLTRDPELRQIPGGQTVATLTVATNFSWTDASGNRQDKAEYHNIVAWRKLAEICGQFLKKGSKVFIEGRLQTRDWEGEDGVKRYKTEIIADNMIMLDRKGVGPAVGASQEFSGGIKDGASGGGASVPAKEVAEDEVTIDDLPF